MNLVTSATDRGGAARLCAGTASAVVKGKNSDTYRPYVRSSALLRHNVPRKKDTLIGRFSGLAGRPIARIEQIWLIGQEAGPIPHRVLLAGDRPTLILILAGPLLSPTAMPRATRADPALIRRCSQKNAVCGKEDGAGVCAGSSKLCETASGGSSAVLLSSSMRCWLASSPWQPWL